MADHPILALEDVAIDYVRRRHTMRAVDGLSFRLNPGEAYGLVGESGCGKSTVALAVMRYLGRGGRIGAGRILFEGSDIATLDDRALRALRGHRLAMVYQDPMSSLNPVMTIGRQLVEVPLLHGSRDRAAAMARARQVLTEVELADPDGVMARYPHQLSGGQQQRVVIAMALMTEPSLLILDEPTTGLDVTVEAAVLDLVDRLRRRHGTAVLFISHNLGAVARLCDRVGVLYAGKLVEEGPVGRIFGNPRHPYTRGLIRSIPTMSGARSNAALAPIPGTLTAAARAARGCSFAERCALAAADCGAGPIALQPEQDAGHLVRCLRPGVEQAVALPPKPARRIGEDLLQVDGLAKLFRVTTGLFRRRTRNVAALTGVTLSVARGETLAIVGESGSGKSTLARIIAGLTTADGGTARFEGRDIAGLTLDRRPADLRRHLKMVFQNPDSTLNPSHSIGFILTRPLRRVRGMTRAQAKAEAERLLDLVNLPRDFMLRRPDELSGGQRQRIAIARALATEPSLIIADEPVSALDVSVQAAVVNLFAELQARTGVGLVFISHDLAMVRHIADRVAVMYRGTLVEYGPVDAIFAPPFHPYTASLMAAAPTLDPGTARQPPAIVAPLPAPTGGCVFVDRCAVRIEACARSIPPLRAAKAGHLIACHHDPAQALRPAALSPHHAAAIAATP